MAIKEFEIGPQNYFEQGYFDGDYTYPNVSRSYLECDIDNIRGLRVVTGEYYQDNYIDGTYYHANQIIFNLTVNQTVVKSADIQASGYIQDTYYQNNYYQNNGMQAVMAVTGGVIYTSAVSMTVTSSQTATISHIEGADLFAFSEAAISLTISRIRDVNSQLNSEFSAAIQATRVKHFSSDGFSDVSLVAIDTRVRFMEAAVQAAFSLSVVTGQTQDASCQMSVAASLECQARRKHLLDAHLNAEFGLTVDVLRIKSSQSQPDVAAILTAVAQTNRQLSAALAADCQLSAIISHIEGADLVAFANASLNTIAVKTAQAQINASSNSTLAITPLKIKQLSAAASVTATQITVISIANRRPRAVTVIGSPSFSTTKKFGSHSIFLPKPTNIGDVNENYLIIPRSTDFDQWGTIDFWIYYTREDNRNYAPIMFYGPENNFNWRLNIASVGINGGYLNYFENNGNVSRAWANGLLPLNSWNHIHLKRSSGTITAWINGSQAQLQSSTGNLLSSFPTTGDFRIGYAGFGQQNSIYVDELLIRTTALDGGSAPTEAWYIGNQTDVQMLFHFDNNYVDDMTGLIQVTSSMSVTASLAATVDNQTKSGQAALVSQGFVLAAIGRIPAQTANLDCQFNLAVSLTKLKNAQADLTAAFNLSAVAEDLDLATADLSAAFTMTIVADKLRSFIVTQPVISQLTAQATRTIASWRVSYFGRGIVDNQTRQIVLDQNESYELATYGLTLPNRGLTLVKRDMARGDIVWRKNLELFASSTNAQFGYYSLVLYQSSLYANIGYNLQGTFRNAMVKIASSTGQIESQWNLDDFIEVRDFAIDSTGIYVSGDAYTDANRNRPKVAKYNNQGQLQWAVEVSPVNNTIATGQKIYIRNSKIYWSFTRQNLTTQERDVWITRLNLSGQFTYSQQMQFKEYQDFYVDDQENYYVLGSTELPVTAGGILAKVDSQGQLQWSRSFGWQPGRLTVDSDQSIYMVTTNGRLLKISSQGFFQWGWTWSSRENNLASYQPAFFTDLALTDSEIINAGYLTNTASSVTQPSLYWSVPKDTGGSAAAINFPYGDFTWAAYQPIESNNPITLTLTSTPTTETAQPYQSLGMGTTASDNTLTTFNYFYPVNATGSWTSAVTVTAAISRIRSSAATANISSDLAATARKLANLSAALAVTAVQTTSATRIKQLAGQLTSNFTAITQAIKATVTTAGISAELTMVTSADRTRSTAATAASSSQQTTAAIKTADSQANITAFGSQLTAAVKIGQGLIGLDVVVSCQALATITTGSQAEFSANTNLAATAESIIRPQADLVASAAFTLIPDYLRRPEANLTTSTSLICAADRIRGITSIESADFGLIADNSRTRTTTISLASTTGLTTNNQIVRLAAATMTSQATSLFIITVVVRFQASLTCQGFQLTTGSIIHIDPYYQLTIEAESRGLKVAKESRLLAIDPETRVNKIQG